MKKIIILWLFALLSNYNAAQEINPGDERLLFDYQNILRITPSSSAEIITGSPFTTDDFVLGTVTGYKQKYFLRYDAYNDQIQVKDNNDQILIVNKKTINEVTFNDGTKYVVFDYTLDENNMNGYLEVLVSDSTVSLFKKDIVKFIRAQKANSGYEKAAPAGYKKGKDRYLISIKNSTIISFNKKKDLLKLFPDHKNDIEKFIKSDKIKLSKERDLVKLVNHINTIL
jgi:hypothetical protein